MIYEDSTTLNPNNQKNGHKNVCINHGTNGSEYWHLSVRIFWKIMKEVWERQQNQQHDKMGICTAALTLPRNATPTLPPCRWRHGPPSQWIFWQRDKKRDGTCNICLRNTYKNTLKDSQKVCLPQCTASYILSMRKGTLSMASHQKWRNCLTSVVPCHRQHRINQLTKLFSLLNLLSSTVSSCISYWYICHTKESNGSGWALPWTISPILHMWVLFSGTCMVYPKFPESISTTPSTVIRFIKFILMYAVFSNT